MQNRKKGDTRAKFEKRQERIAVMVMILCVLPILYIYGKFFMNAFMNQQTGESEASQILISLRIPLQSEIV